MEPLRLSDFYQSVSVWPNGVSELAAVAEKVALLLNAPFVAIQKSDSETKTAWSLAGISEYPVPGLVEDYIGAKIRQSRELFSGVAGTSVRLKTLFAGEDRQPWQGSASLKSISVVNISGDHQAATVGARAGKGRVDYAWLLVATTRPLGPREEDLCVAAAQRLASLAENSALEGDIQLRNQFLSIASHELKTPLTSIYGVLQLQERMQRMQKDEPQQLFRERQESYLKMAIRQTRRLNELIDGLLDVSRIQNGRFFAEPSDTDVAALLKELVAGRLAIIADEAGVRLSVDVPESARAWVDPVRIEEVVTNLVMNAIRFSPEGGVIWIRLQSPNGILHLSVRDQGPSVPVEDRERIFQPFERAQRTARFGGLGLGLFISRQIARLHGGDVLLTESIPGKGNLFDATFPLRGRDSLTEAG